MNVKKPILQKGFTLLELIVVIAIIGLLAAIAVPALNNMKRSDATVSATRQLLDDVGRARQLAISRNTTVYMIFCPAVFWNDPGYTSLPGDLQAPGTNLWNKQLTSYAFVTLRSVGDQPGGALPDYIGPWHTLPENTFIPTTTKLFLAPNQYVRITDAITSRYYDVFGFSMTNGIPFPTEDAYDPGVPGRKFAYVPYLAFNYLGQLVSGSPGRDEYIPLARGTVAHGRDAKTRAPRRSAPELVENPPGNSTNAFNLIHIDRLTGRARHIQQEISGL